MKEKNFNYAKAMEQVKSIIKEYKEEKQKNKEKPEEVASADGQEEKEE